MVMSFLGGLASGALGLVGSLFGAKQQQSYNVQNMATQNKYNTQEMKYANDLNKDLALYNQGLTLQNLQSTPYALRQGMEYAGFNPILAYSSGNFSNASQSGSSPALGTSLPSSPKQDYGSAVSNAFQTGIAIQDQLNKSKLTNAQVDNINADTMIKKYGKFASTFNNAIEVLKDPKVSPKIKNAISAVISKFKDVDFHNLKSTNAMDRDFSFGHINFKRNSDGYINFNRLKSLLRGTPTFEIGISKNDTYHKYHDFSSWSNSKYKFKGEYLHDRDLFDYPIEYYENKRRKH